MIAEIITDLRVSSPETVQSPPAIEVGPLPAVRADPVMCRQLLENLIGNALKYVRPGRTAQVQISASTEPGYPSPVEMVHVQIADQGTGIPSGQPERLFASFYRAHTEFPGTGLGLAICQRVIDRHGGTIKVTDNPGGGSVFHFTLPFASVPQDGVLLVDDSPDDVILTVWAFRKCGISNEIMLTSSIHDRDIEQSYACGANSYLQKPINANFCRWRKPWGSTGCRWTKPPMSTRPFGRLER